jgi:hypothetical protein
VLVYRIDRYFGICVWLFTGPTNTDDDFERYCGSFALADEAAAVLPMRPVALLWVDRDNPLPNAKWRRRIAEASTTLRSRPAIAFASPSPLIRGIVTAVEWLRPAPYDFVVASTFEEALRYLEERRGAALLRVAELLAECRQEAEARLTLER